ncbi:substrate-binding periplasmic protein [Cellvibrio polysaccharolyticus]|uniref:Solute-binding protein family 3/N-terminal domain-containing protein n=1 Tax=Cellvibrio polysaccharolyticus TaxID=2082724 RepID=A0A928V6L4_9GAMM|nr:transporter substrate-binding domain-containing protein [Cellvibrio polysaccharolyticus]MBE8718115.1 hypothetical protein [Cellvibrio polysaccharolyticus]
MKKTNWQSSRRNLHRSLTRGLAPFFMAWVAASASVTQAAENTFSFISLDVAPWASKNPVTGENEGAFVEIVKEVERRLQKEVEITITPLARVERELQAGTRDCTILISLPDELVVKGSVVATHGIGFIARKGVHIREYNDIKPLKLSVIRGGLVNDEFDNDENLHKEFDTDYLMGLRKVARGRLDAIVGAIPTLQYLAEQEGLSDSLEAPFPVLEVPLVFQCSRNSPNLDQMEAIDKILVSIKEDGTLEKIQKQYHF